MNDFQLLPKERRTLRKMRHRDYVPAEEIYNCHKLYENDFIVPNHLNERDGFNVPIPDGTYRLSEKYWRYIESRKWFNAEYVFSHIFIPIFIGAISAVITLLLSRVFL